MSNTIYTVSGVDRDKYELKQQLDDLLRDDEKISDMDAIPIWPPINHRDAYGDILEEHDE